eukprot:TRINITY_DN65693_c0_g1_i1.p1 TRINITY_DN65693_c0_g1~~TRINITY_DN65693_c0_g1_i1.p1  ORF type:complete len:665 (+),score=145.47 TRINITY_DN65693_c0_g1_i1:148-2142(+)
MPAGELRPPALQPQKSVSMRRSHSERRSTRFQEPPLPEVVLSPPVGRANTWRGLLRRIALPLQQQFAEGAARMAIRGLDTHEVSHLQQLIAGEEKEERLSVTRNRRRSSGIRVEDVKQFTNPDDTPDSSRRASLVDTPEPTAKELMAAFADLALARGWTGGQLKGSRRSSRVSQQSDAETNIPAVCLRPEKLAKAVDVDDLNWLSSKGLAARLWNAQCLAVASEDFETNKARLLVVVPGEGATMGRWVSDSVQKKADWTSVYEFKRWAAANGYAFIYFSPYEMKDATAARMVWQETVVDSAAEIVAIVCGPGGTANLEDMLNLGSSDDLNRICAAYDGSELLVAAAEDGTEAPPLANFNIPQLERVSLMLYESAPTSAASFFKALFDGLERRCSGHWRSKVAKHTCDIQVKLHPSFQSQSSSPSRLAADRTSRVRLLSFGNNVSEDANTPRTPRTAGSGRSRISLSPRAYGSVRSSHSHSPGVMQRMKTEPAGHLGDGAEGKEAPPDDSNTLVTKKKAESKDAVEFFVAIVGALELHEVVAGGIVVTAVDCLKEEDLPISPFTWRPLVVTAVRLAIRTMLPSRHEPHQVKHGDLSVAEVVERRLLRVVERWFPREAADAAYEIFLRRRCINTLALDDFLANLPLKRAREHAPCEPSMRVSVVEV